MTFINEKIIYEKNNVKVYINQCHNKGKKTNLFAVRRDDITGYAHLLGLIRFSGRWRQYVFMPDINQETMWSRSCLLGIADFIFNQNYKWRNRIK